MNEASTCLVQFCGASQVFCMCECKSATFTMCPFRVGNRICFRSLHCSKSVLHLVAAVPFRDGRARVYLTQGSDMDVLWTSADPLHIPGVEHFFQPTSKNIRISRWRFYLVFGLACFAAPSGPLLCSGFMLSLVLQRWLPLVFRCPLCSRHRVGSACVRVFA